jgi:dTDP-4-dehydrorhamnose reductase
MNPPDWSLDKRTVGSHNSTKLAVWGGVECTRNRVADRYFDQVEATGHGGRLGDLDLVAELGFRTLRYPVLWESIAPNGLATADWGDTDRRLSRLRELEITPIVGFVHHGSGPLQTSLLDPEFPQLLAAFARAVAERYPWLRRFTPINEPVTTARFSGLYGHWYPHRRDDAAFARMVIQQCRAVALAMRAIRESIPDAELVHIDDAGRTYGTPPLDYQVAFDNDRRWLGFDLLTGRVTPDHPLYGYLASNGIDGRELEEFSRSPCPPDVVGLNYYVTSDRFLDHRTALYPPSVCGGNGRIQYADVEAVRARADGIYGHRALLLQAWERYRLPIAVTEVHLGCSREEQLRWLLEAWKGANEAREAGADVRAITAWALFGSMDWDSLVTRQAGHYEPGAFDVRAPAPRVTAIGRALQELIDGGAMHHPVLEGAGWWQRSSRLLPSLPRAGERITRLGRSPRRPLLVCGASGTLGQAFARACTERGIAHRLLSRAEMDIARASSVQAALERFQPWAIVNAAGFVRVDEAEQRVAQCWRENRIGPAILARYCQQYGVSLLTFSSDLVFDGAKGTPYVESDPRGPLSIYGRSKAAAETHVLAAMPQALVVRTSAFFGPRGEHDFVTRVLSALRAGCAVEVDADIRISPTYVPDLASVCLDLLIDRESGIWHVSNRGEVSWAELAVKAAEMAGLDVSLVRPRRSSELKRIAPQPAYSVLGSERGNLMPSLEDAMSRYFIARREAEEELDGAALSRAH